MLTAREIRNLERRYNFGDPLDVLRYVARTGYAWPGGYEMALGMDDGAAICNRCARAEYRQLFQSTKEKARDGWQVVSWISADSMDEPDYCAHCNRAIGPEIGEN